MLPNQLFLWPAEILYVCRGNVNEMHDHYALSLWISFEGEFHFETEQEKGKGRTAIVPPNLRHRLHAPDCHMAVLQVDPDARDYRSLLGLASAGRIQELDSHNFAPCLADLRTLLEGGSCEQARAAFEAVLGTALQGLPRVDRPLDARIEKILVQWKRELPERVLLEEVAGSVKLSATRLMHLFKQEMGLPVRRYLLWLRTNIAVRLLKAGLSLTDAAHEAGFADSAHMSRTFKDMIGIHPSFFFKDSRFVQAHFCPVR